MAGSRNHRFRLLCAAVVALLALCLLGSPAAAQRRAAREAARPASDSLSAAAAEAIDAGSLAQLPAKLDPDITDALKDFDRLDAGRLTHLAALREFGRYFGKLQPLTDERRETLRWLASKPDLLVPLMLAVSDADDPGRVLTVLSALHKELGDGAAEHPDLTTAFCVVWDHPPQPGFVLEGEKTGLSNGQGNFPKTATGQSGPRPLESDLDAESLARLVDLYRYYTDPRNKLRINPSALPWQLAVYVVDNPVSPAERKWALGRYRSKGFSGGVYREVAYDLGIYYTGQTQKRGGRPYTLANIVRYGGVCKDQAYYAASVAKSLGIPATVCTGSGGTGRGAHAWIGFLQAKGGNRSDPAWDFNEGRYEEHLYWSGAVTDPQTGATLTDADVGLLAELLETPAEQRLASVALWKLHDRAAPGRHPDLYSAAINLSAGNRYAWMGLAQLGAAGKLTPAQADEVAKVVSKFALKKYPDFAFDVCRQMAAGRPPAERMRLMRKMESLFERRPDLVASLQVDRGDLLREQSKPNEALKAYTDLLSRNLEAGPIVLTAMQRTDLMLREAGKLDELARVYEQLWGKLPVPEASAFAATAPYYKVGQRYADLLDTMGRRPEAAEVRAKLARLDEGAG